MAEGKGSARPMPIAVDGGWGWMVLIGSFIAYFIADGWSYSFGVFYPSLLVQFNEGKGKTALIGALLYGVPLLVSPVVCALTNTYGCRIVCVIGGFITGISLVCSMFAQSVYALCVTTGVLASIGLAMTYVPSLVIVTYYFERRRGLVTGLAVTGSGLGAFAFPPLMEFLQNEYTWRGMLLIFGGIAFNIMVSGALYRPPPTLENASDFRSEEMLQPRTVGVLTSSPYFYHISMQTQAYVNVPKMHEDYALSKVRSQSITALDKSPKKQYIFPNYFEIAQLKTDNNTNSLKVPHSSHSQSVSAESRLLAQDDDNRKCQSMRSISSPDLYHEAQADVSEQNGTIKGSYISVNSDRRKRNCVERFWRELKKLCLAMMDRSLFINAAYLLWCASSFVLYLWMGVPYVYLIDKAKLLDTVSEEKAAFLLSIIGIGRTGGQLVLGYLGDVRKINALLLYAIAIAASGIATIMVPLCLDYTSLCLFSAAFGMFISVTYVLQMLCLVKIVGLNRATKAFGLFQLVQGVATILGTPLAGLVFDVTNSYDLSFYVAGAIILVSGIMLFPLPLLVKKQKQKAHPAISISGQLS